MRSIGVMVYSKVKVFVREAGLIIVAISIVLWFLSTHGSDERFEKLSAVESSVQPNDVQTLQAVKTQKLEYSYIGKLGQAIEPVIAPLGFDWKIGIALLTSFAAREVFVGTMATIYQSSDSKNSESIREKLQAERNGHGQLQFSKAVCWSLLLFYAFALQCMSTVAVVRRETKSWGWVLAQFVFMFSLAWLSAFSVYHLLS